MNWVCSVVENFFRIHLRHIKLFQDLQILSLSTNLTFKTPTLVLIRFQNKSYSLYKVSLLTCLWSRKSEVSLLIKYFQMRFLNAACRTKMKEFIIIQIEKRKNRTHVFSDVSRYRYEAYIQLKNTSQLPLNIFFIRCV